MGLKQKHYKRKVLKNLRMRRKRKKQAKSNLDEPEELKRAPHSFVIHKGNVGRYVSQLVMDFRKVMDPFTASNLQVRKKNTLRDFVAIAGPLKVSHLVMFTSSVIGPYMRIARFPQGPTLMFRIHNYSLVKDVLSSLKKQVTNKKLFANSPLLVLNNFTGDGHIVRLMASVFQNMFPTINVTTVQLSDIRRCVVFNYDANTKLIEFRHYAIRVVPVGISRGVKKIVQSKVPNLAKYEDISEFLTKPSMTSESEMEEDESSRVQVAQSLPTRGSVVAQQSSIRMSELGPRLTLQLIKVEENLLSGEVMFHEYVKKTEEEKELIRQRLARKKKLKEKRKQQQEENVKKKELQRKMHKERSLLGMKGKRKLDGEDEGEDEGENEGDGEGDGEGEDEGDGEGESADEGKKRYKYGNVASGAKKNNERIYKRDAKKNNERIYKRDAKKNNERMYKRDAKKNNETIYKRDAKKNNETIYKRDASFKTKKQYSRMGKTHPNIRGKNGHRKSDKFVSNRKGKSKGRR